MSEVDRNTVIATVLPDHRRWLHKVANSMLPPDSPDHDDLAQEGMIALWRAVGTYDPDRKVPMAAWLRYKAAHRMRSVVSGHANMTGSEAYDYPRATPKGKATRDRIRGYLREHPGAGTVEIARALGLSNGTVSFHRRKLHVDVDAPAPAASLSELLDDGFDLTDAADVLEQVIEGYHEGRILEAIGELTPAQRRYVMLRFWGGLGTTELTEEFGYEPRGIWRGARERLRPLLADLVAV